MNQQNLEKLKDNLKFMGFGDKLYADLEKNIQQGFPEFILKMQSEFGSSRLESVLHFRRGDGNDLYFFNRHDETLKNDQGLKEHSFYVNRGHGVTLKEAFNLLDGRAVFKEMQPKEGEKYHAWIQLDFSQKELGNYKVKQFHENYGYDLQAALEKFPIKALQDETGKERLMTSLKRGNLQAVDMESGGKVQRVLVEANPQYKSVSLYNEHRTLLTREQREGLMISPPRPEKQDDSLLPKNRNSEKKGLSV